MSFFPEFHAEYAITQAFFESTFISLMLFFWILTVHSVAQSEELFNIDEGKFFRPKIVLCFCLWVYMCTERTYLLIMRQKDPIYYTDPNRDSNFVTIRLCGLIFIMLYVVYLVILAYMMLYVLKDMKKSYKYVIL